MKSHIGARARLALLFAPALAIGAVATAPALAARPAARPGPLAAASTTTTDTTAPPAPTPPKAATGVTSVDTSACTDPLLSQPFSSIRDNNYYTLVAGESAAGITGEGWTLGGGASIETGTLADGTSGSVLDLPAGGYAVSPAVCVTSAYPTAKAVMKDVTGPGGVQFYVSYEGTPTWTKPHASGALNTPGSDSGWADSTAVNLQPANTTGWQIVRFVFSVNGKNSESQLSQFWVDPRMRC